MKLLKFFLSFTLTCLIGGAIYIGYKNNFWNVFNHLQEANPQNLLEAAFTNLSNAQSAQITGNITYSYPFQSKDNQIKKDYDLQISSKLDGKIVFPNQIDLNVLFDITPFQKIVSTILQGEAAKKLTQEDLNAIEVSIRSFDDNLYFLIPSLWQGWIKKATLIENIVDVTPTILLSSTPISSPVTLKVKHNKIVYAQQLTVSPTLSTTHISTPSPSMTTLSSAPTYIPQTVTPLSIDEVKTTILSSLQYNTLADLEEIQPTEETIASEIQEYSGTLHNDAPLHPLFTHILSCSPDKNPTIKITIHKKTQTLQKVLFQCQNFNSVAYEITMAEYEKNNQQRIGEFRKIQLALEDYFERNNTYPQAASYFDLKKSLVPDFISSLPRNPTGENYRYATNTEGTYYELFVQLDPTYSNPEPTNYKIVSNRSSANSVALIAVPTISQHTPLSPNSFRETDVSLEITFESFNLPLEIERPNSTILPRDQQVNSLPKTSSFYEVFTEIASYQEAMTRDNQRFNDLMLIEKALHSYYAENGIYPVAADLIASNSEENTLKKLVPTYVTTLPTDPIQNRWYGYKSPLGKNFLLTCVLENPYNPYGEQQTNYILYRVTNVIKSIEPQTTVKKGTYSVEELLQTIPVFRHILDWFTSPTLSTPTSTPNPNISPTQQTSSPTSTPLSSEYISQLTAQESIQRIENNNVQNLVFKEQQTLAFFIPVYLFEATLKEPSISVKYWVSASTGEVLRRELLNQAIGKIRFSLEDAQKNAEAFAKRYFEDFEKQNFTIDKKEATSTDQYHVFTWIKKDSTTTAILPTQIEIYFNPDTGNVDLYAAMRIKVTLEDTNPYILQSNAENTARLESKDKATNKELSFKIVTSGLYVLENPKKAGEQVLAWKIITWQENESTVGDTEKGEGFTILINADTGSILSTEKYP